MEYSVRPHHKDIVKESLRPLCTKLVLWIVNHIEDVLVPFILEDHYVSKRLIYWTVSMYAKQHTLIVQSEYISDVFQDYTNCLHYYHRELFDTFCRQPYLIDLEFVFQTLDHWRLFWRKKALPPNVEQQIFVFLQGRCWVRVSVGQLNFFYWAQTRRILSYVVQHASELMSEMKLASKHKRRKLSNSETAHRIGVV